MVPLFRQMRLQSLKRLLQQEVDSHDAMLSSTPHLSEIRHAAARLLALLEEPNRRPSRESEPCPPTDPNP